MTHYSIIVDSDGEPVFEKSLGNLKRKDTITFCKSSTDSNDVILAWDEAQIKGWKLDQKAIPMDPIIPDEFGHTSHGVVLSNGKNTAARFKVKGNKAKDLVVHLHMIEDDRSRTCRGSTQLRIGVKKESA